MEPRIMGTNHANFFFIFYGSNLLQMNEFIKLRGMHHRSTTDYSPNSSSLVAVPLDKQGPACPSGFFKIGHYLNLPNGEKAY